MCSAPHISEDFFTIATWINLCTCGASIPPSLAKREQRPERVQLAKFLDHSLHQKWVTKRDKPAPTYCCSPDIGWEKLGSDNIHECKVCCSKEFSCKKTQILNIFENIGSEAFWKGKISPTRANAVWLTEPWGLAAAPKQERAAMRRQTTKRGRLVWEKNRCFV